MSNVILNRNDFYKEFISPLEEAFGFKTHWNGKHVEEIGLEQLSSNYNGMSFCTRVNAPIIIKYRKNSYDMFRTLIHEYAHSYLHSKDYNSDGYSLKRPFKEVEAETVSKKVFEKLGLEYLNTWYIPHYSKKCKQKDLDNYDEYTRNMQIDSLVDEIADIFKYKADLINSLNRENQINKNAIDYKYTVTCPCCNMVWKYKKKAKIIKVNAKNFWCTTCGKEKSKDKLVVKEL